MMCAPMEVIFMHYAICIEIKEEGICMAENKKCWKKKQIKKRNNKNGKKKQLLTL